MSTLFISDLHLHQAHPAITQNFFYFLDSIATNVDALYILGDLFTVWIGDDNNDIFYGEVADKLTQWKKTHNVPIYFMHGNRDFLVGQEFLNKIGAELLIEPSIIDLYGTKTLLLHGDSLCLDDVRYQYYRKVVRQKWVQWLYLQLPLSWRHRVANKISGASQERKQKIIDVCPNEIPRIMHKHQVSLLIHGHTHLPSIHLVKNNSDYLTRIVLSDWDRQGNVLEYHPSGEKFLYYFSA